MARHKVQSLKIDRSITSSRHERDGITYVDFYLNLPTITVQVKDPQWKQAELLKEAKRYFAQVLANLVEQLVSK